MISAILISRPVTGQEALRSSLAGNTAAEATLIHPESLPYTIKSGDFRLLATPSLALDWNDNVYLTKDNAKDDFIIRPLLGLNASYPVTQRNLLQLNVTFGYQKYVQHDDLSSWYVQSGSALSFDVFVKDFRFNFHDQFSYIQDSAQEAAVAGTGSYGTLRNLAGLSTTWDLEDVTLTLGYDHQIVKSTTQQFQSQDGASELVVAQAGLKVNPSITVGLEGTGAFTRYDENVLNDNDNYSAGLYSDWHPSQYLHLQARGGYTTVQFQHTSQSIQTGNLDTWYVGLTATHQLSAGVSYSLNAGHDVRLGIESDLIDEWYVTPTVNWSVIKNWTFQTGLSYQHGKQGTANVAGNLVENYDWFGANLGINHAITDRLGAGLSYRLTLRSSDQPSREYTQNLIELQLTYRLQ